MPGWVNSKSGTSDFTVSTIGKKAAVKGFSPRTGLIH
jgi:hypothetical protein